MQPVIQSHIYIYIYLYMGSIYIDTYVMHIQYGCIIHTFIYIYPYYQVCLTCFAMIRATVPIYVYTYSYMHICIHAYRHILSIYNTYTIHVYNTYIHMSHLFRYDGGYSPYNSHIHTNTYPYNI
jgi:hypothetical protein